MHPAHLPTLQDLHTAQQKHLPSLPPEQLSALKQRIYEPVACMIEVRKVLGPFLNEYMYQDALEVEFERRHLPRTKEYYFTVDYKGTIIRHKHFCDFMYGEGEDRVIIECKAVDALGSEQRQQLWNYMRLTGVRTGILYNFAPVKAQIERYYLPENSPTMVAF